MTIEMSPIRSRRPSCLYPAVAMPSPDRSTPDPDTRNDRRGLFGFGCLGWSLILLTVLPLLIAGSLSLWWKRRQALAEQAIADRLQTLSTQGIPIDAISLQTYYNRTTTNNGADLWRSIRDQLNSEPFATSLGNVLIAVDGKEIPPPGKPYPADKEVQQFLDDNAEFFHEIDQWLDADTHFRVEVDFRDFDTVFDQISDQRNLARVLRVKARHSIHHGDSVSAHQALRNGIFFARSQEKSPLLISHLVRIAVESVAMDSVDMSLEADTLDQSQLSDLLEAIDALDPSAESLRNAILGERAFTLDGFNRDVFADEDLFFEEPDGLQRTLGGHATDKLSAIESFDLWLRAVSDDLVKDAPLLLDIADQQSRSLQQLNVFQQAERYVSATLMPPIQMSVLAFLRNEHERLLVRTAIAARLFRHQESRWPQSVDELQRVGLDPRSVHPCGDRLFGIREQTDDTLLVWGFDPTTDDSAFSELAPTPAEPPDLTLNPDRDMVIRISAKPQENE
ncbi:hypothetical protein [Crateriforma conspicua]|uniref:Uncharacterized protein n=1 Tax=Crateriforma conspicua TaxID=2527996 RepID=A0A5C5YC94_9PLAN|nr:hypothetical protein [Crateriforma conspicua]TWT72548.1 hypothetical protein Pan14r_48680 [Crateriforma conspicua]